MAEDEIVGWHHWLNGCEFEQAQGGGKGQGVLASLSPQGHKESDMTERLSNNSTYKSNTQRDDIQLDVLLSQF